MIPPNTDEVSLIPPNVEDSLAEIVLDGLSFAYLRRLVLISSNRTGRP